MDVMADTQASWPLFSMDIRFEQDVVQARQRARQIASNLQYDHQELTRIATAVSELVRYAFKFGGFNQVSFSLVGKKFRVAVWGEFPEHDVTNSTWSDQSLLNDPRSLGLLSARKLMDEFDVRTEGRGIELFFTKSLPATFPPFSSSTLIELSRNLEDQRIHDPYEEIKQQNRELIFALNALKNQQNELEQLNRELAETNQGVLALYAELEDRALSLQKASEAKSLFFSNMTHEFRTPLNSAISLVRMLLDRQDGELTSEQERQVIYIRKSIEDLSQMVNDLLDIAKIESGKICIRAAPFAVHELFSALRGMFRPILTDHVDIKLIFEEVAHLPLIMSDESKVSQILRNFISNALKNTAAGEIRVTAQSVEDHHLIFSVADTGIGIAPEDHMRIFEEFVQIDTIGTPVHHGTGLGLPLSKRLATLLGGRIILESALGEGSTFSLILPLSFLDERDSDSRKRDALPLKNDVLVSETGDRAWLILDSNAMNRYLLQYLLRDEGFRVYEASQPQEGLDLVRHKYPEGIILNQAIDGNRGLDFLEKLKTDPTTRHIPVVVIQDKLDLSEVKKVVHGLEGLVPASHEVS